MKRLCLILWMCSCTVNLHAQTIYPVETYFDHVDEDNVYFKDVNHRYDKFLGAWEFSNSETYFKVDFFKVIKEQEAPGLLKITRYWDKIESRFQYKRKVNNVWTVVYDTFNEQSGTYYFSGSLTPTATTLDMDYFEPPIIGTCPRYRSGSLTLVFSLTLSGPQLQWIRVDREKTGVNLDNPCPDGSPRDASAFQIPTTMVLTKVN